jgi:GPH family glycoside/pentoside/hexuronide:cation symporter
VPADKPEVLIYVIVDEPNVEKQSNSKYASNLAKEILEDILPYLNVYSTKEPEVPVVPEVPVEEETGTGVPEEPEEEAVPFGPAMGMLFKNKYWVIVLLFNLITNITNAITGSAGTYYCKWIFGNDNLVGLLGAAGMLATIIGFALSKPIIAKLGVTRTVSVGCLGAAISAAIRCFIPTSLPVYIATGLLGSFIQIPLMCLYGVLLAMAVDYNEWKYDKKLVAMSSGAIGFGAKVGGGLGSLLLSAFLIIGSYDATLAVASDSMRLSIYGFSNYLPVVINILMFFIFQGFDLEKKLPQLREEVAERRRG